MKSTAKTFAQLSLIAGCGFAAGVINGLLGAGSGVLLVYALRSILPRHSAGSRDIFANAIATVLPLSFFSALSYFQKVSLPPLTELMPYLLPGLLGGLIGARLLGKLPEAVIQKIFGTVVLISGAAMLFR